MNHMPQDSVKELRILMPGTNPAALSATVLGANRNNIFLAFFSPSCNYEQKMLQCGNILATCTFLSD